MQQVNNLDIKKGEATDDDKAPTESKVEEQPDTAKYEDISIVV